MAEKNWGHTVLGWFVVKDEYGQPAGDADAAYSGSLVEAADARRRGEPLPAASPSAPASAKVSATVPAPPKSTPAAAPPIAPPLPVFQKEPPPPTGGVVDFAKVFEAAQIDPGEQERVAKSAGLVRSLPAETDPLVKKQIVEASLKAFGIPIDKIIETGVEEIQAMEGYIRAVASAAQKNVAESEERIKKLEETIRDLRDDMQKRVVEQQAVIRACNDKKLEVQHILEFFGQEAVAKVVQESPKLHDPTKVP